MAGPSFVPKLTPDLAGPRPAVDGDAPAPTGKDAARRAARLAPTFDAGQAVLAAPAQEAPPSSEHQRHERRMALIEARKTLHLTLHATIQEKFNRDASALKAFEARMTFAKDENVVSMVIGTAFESLTMVLPPPLNTVAKGVTLVAGAYRKADEASKGKQLARWIEAHRLAVDREREKAYDHVAHSEIALVDEQIETLVADDTAAGERQRDCWEEVMVTAEFPVEHTSAELERALLREWLSDHGARFVAQAYRTDRNYPGDEEIGRDGANVRFGGQQITPVNVPQHLLDSLPPGADPLKELPVPLDVEHYERAGVGNAAWRHTGTTTPDRPGARR
ncbi:MAG: hypothetical protein H6745_16755 [Deltaproteobacteria bacterium]|nr:hypothetical protein [Deltaproteobacteria bacterium]